MKVAVIGSGYVGLVTGVCFSEVGNTVICVDREEKKIEMLNSGKVPIFEPGLEEMLQRNMQEGRLSFTTNIAKALETATVCFIAVGTPMGADGSADLRHVLDVAGEIGRNMVHDMVIVDKSTVPVGTAKQVTAVIQAELEKRGASYRFEVVSNPEFLKEGAAIHDFSRPDRVVIGAESAEAVQTIRDLYAPYVVNHDRFIVMDVASAEMTKYASNAMLATRISFMNEIADICEAVGADIGKVRLGMGADSRIGTNFLYAGCGYGGSCFPKDVQALIKTAKDFRVSTDILESVETRNYKQKRVLAQKIVKRFGEDLKGLTFAVWGLAFKPNTDDIREAPSLVLIEELLEKGAALKLYDPKAMEEVRALYPASDTIIYCENKYAALEQADAMILVTEWGSFRSPDFQQMKESMKQPVIFDGRNQYRSGLLEQMGFEYYQIGVGK